MENNNPRTINQDDTSSLAELINALNHTIVISRKIGTYPSLEALCLDRLMLLIKSIKVQS